jgi:hypothetical protein
VRRSLAFLLLLAAGCAGPAGPEVVAVGTDPHSFSRPEEIAVEHIELDLEVDFDARRLRGRATLTLEHRLGGDELWLDAWGLDIRAVRLDDDAAAAEFRLGDEVEFVGQPLIVTVRPGTERVHIDYETGERAIGLQWFEPDQTATRRHPFLLTQSETVFARSWVPCQDTPRARFTYGARLRVPEGMTALMSAVNGTEPAEDGAWRFRMPQPIPSYLLALAVGEVAFRPLGERTGVWAELPVLERAADEFAETEAMLRIAEELFGPYRWERYDLIVLPPGFPWGGMENPRLTFVTPTLITGDRSLVSTIAHEIAHSWSGNLVAAGSWGDLWLNEGLTSYCERRIMEELRGAGEVDMVAFVDQQGLRDAIEELGPESPDTHLRLDLAGRDPDASFGDVAYEKGYLFFRLLEETFGRASWDRFLRDYFDGFAFSAVDTDGFLAFLDEQLIAGRPDADEIRAAIDIPAWVDGPGLPQNAPRLDTTTLEAVEDQARLFVEGAPAKGLVTAGWTTQHWVHFIRRLPGALPHERLAELDAAYGLTGSGNAVILQAWLLEAVRRDYRPADAALEGFLGKVGRQYLIRPLYRALTVSETGRERARRIFEASAAGYHPVVRRAIASDLGG